MAKRKRKLTDPCPGFALRVGGHHPYIGGEFVPSIGDPNASAKAEAQCKQPYHRAVAAVVVPLSEYRWLLKAAKEASRP